MNKPGGKSGFRRLPGAVAVAAVAALTVAGCGGQPAGSVKQGGVFNLGSDTSIDSLNPFVAFQTDAYTTFDYIYPTLAQYNAKMQLVPDFATSWAVTDGGKVWTFHTVKGAKWSDGKPLTAQDAAWTFATILKYQNGPTANSAGYVAHMASATAPDADTLVLTYKQPVANVLSQVQQVQILPEHVWAKYATGNGKGLTTFTNNAPVVSGGPFILFKYTAKQAALFKRNPTFYGPKPHINGLALEFYTNDDAMIAALKSGQLDGVEAVPNTSVANLAKAGFVVSKTPGDSFDDLIINDNPNQLASHRELMNPLVREAFDDAIDRQQIVNTSLLGYGRAWLDHHPAGHRRLVGPGHQADAVQPEPGQCATGPGRIQEGCQWHPGRGRAPDVVHGDHAGRHHRPVRRAVVRDHPERLQADRRAADPAGSGQLGRLQRAHGQQVQELRAVHVGLVPRDRPGLHALGADLRVVERLE